MKRLLFLIAAVSLAFTPQSIMPNKVTLSPKQKALGKTASIMSRAIPQSVLPPPPLPTFTLSWSAVTIGVANVDSSVLTVTNYEVWSTTNMLVPMRFEASTQSTNIVMPKDRWNKNYDVRAINSLGFKSPL